MKWLVEGNTVRDNGAILGSKLKQTAECAVTLICLLVIYRACRNRLFPYLLDEYICTPSLRVPGHGVIICYEKKI